MPLLPGLALTLSLCPFHFLLSTRTLPAKILHPAYPGSVYHLTKCLDALVFQFYNKNDGLRVTDLHQGIVWGTNTAQTVRT